MGCGASGSSRSIDSRLVIEESKQSKQEPIVIQEPEREKREDPPQRQTAKDQDSIEDNVNKVQPINAEEPLREVITIGMIKESTDTKEPNAQVQVQPNTQKEDSKAKDVIQQEHHEKQNSINQLNTEDTQPSDSMPPIKDPNWPESKHKFIASCSEIIKANNLESSIDVSITKIISIDKNDYDQFASTIQYKVTLSNKVSNLQWNKKPLVQVKKAIIDLASKDPLIKSSQCFNWSKASNEYESFQSTIKLLRISKANQDLEHYTLSPPENKTLVILIFSLIDESALLLLKEMISYRNANPTAAASFTLLPIYGEQLDNANKSVYIWEIMEKMGITDDQLELYFIEDNKLDNCFKYLTDDNMRKIIPQAIVIDSNRRIRMMIPPERFSFNIIEHLAMNKAEFKEMKTKIFDSLKEKNSDKAFLSTPCNVELFIKRCKVYSFTEEGQGQGQIYYEVLYGKVEQSEVLADKLSSVAQFARRAPRSQNKPTWQQRNGLVTQEMKNFIENVQLTGIKYCSTYHRTNRIISISKEKAHQFTVLPSKTYQMTFELINDLFEQQFQMAITSAMGIFSEYSCFGKINFLNAVPQVNTPFCSKMTLINKDSGTEEDIAIAETQRPSILIIIAPLKEYLPKAELQSRLAKLDKELEELYEHVNVYIIYRGEMDTIADIDFLLEDSLFKRDLSVYVLSTNNNNTFPLYYQNNGIETEDTQLLMIITDSSNKVAYVGNTDDIQVKNTFNALLQVEGEGDTNSVIVFKKNLPMSFDHFNTKVKPLIAQIEKQIRSDFEKEKELLYKPFIDISYNTNTTFTDTQEGDSSINNFRLRILIKERHKELITKSKEMKEIIKSIRSFGGFVQIIPLPCATLEIPSECKKCSREMEEKDPFYFNQETNELYCIDCEKTLEYNDVYLIYFKSTAFDDEVIEEFYEANVRNDQPLDAHLGAECKICKVKLGSVYYVNLTHFNIVSQHSPFEPIDICPCCFGCLEDKKKKFESFKEKTAVNVLGLNGKQMIYRKIIMPQ